jgi:EmrB/QacA subfamily drug resistance transporter
VLTATVLGSSVAFLDATVVGIAQPAFGRDFNASVAGLQWVSIGYMLTLSGLLLLGGALGDRFGRRRIFIVGVVWFGVASILCAAAPSIGFLAGARAVQGVGAALLAPGSLAIIEASFAPQDRAAAIGAWSGLGGVAGAIGPFAGGYIISAFSWRYIFLINAPLVIAVVLITLRHVPETRNPEASGRIDGLGALLALIGLAGLSYGLVSGPSLGWNSPLVVVSLLGSVVAFAVFIEVERRVAEPLVPLGIFRSQQFSATNIVTLLLYAVMGAIFFLMPIELQQVARYTPTASGASLLPITFCLLVFSRYSGALAARIGPRLQMSVGPLLVAVGMLLCTRIDASGSYAVEVLPAVLVFGIGLAVTVAPLTATALSSAPARHAGIASAVNNTVARAGGMLAVAILPAAAGITSYRYAALFEPGFQRAAIIAAMGSAAAGFLAAGLIRNPRERPRVVATAPTALHGGIDCRAPLPVHVRE